MLSVVVLLSACASNEPRVEYNGRQLSDEEIVAMGEMLESETEGQTESETQAVTETEEPPDHIVHWTEGGKVWHERLSCSRLSEKDERQTGSIEQAIEAGKERGCSFCCP